MDAHGFDDDETSLQEERSGIYSTTTAEAIGAVEIADVEVPDVDQIDALPGATTAEEEDERREEAIDALSLVGVDTLHSILGEMLTRVPEDRRVALVCSTICGFSNAGIATTVEQGRQLLETQYANAKTVVAAATLAQRDALLEQREVECALVAALGPYATHAFKAVG